MSVFLGIGKVETLDGHSPISNDPSDPSGSFLIAKCEKETIACRNEGPEGIKIDTKTIEAAIRSLQSCLNGDIHTASLSTAHTRCIRMGCGW